MLKQILIFFYGASGLFFGNLLSFLNPEKLTRYCKYLDNNNIDDSLNNLSSQITLIIDMVEKCSNGNLTERLEVSPDLMGAISDFLNLLIDSLTEEIKKSPFDSF